jgi:hypothetical protein
VNTIRLCELPGPAPRNSGPSVILNGPEIFDINDGAGHPPRNQTLKIDEIVLYPDRTENIEKFAQHFKDADASPAFNGLSLSRNIDPDQDVIGLFDDTQLVAVLHLNVRTHGMWQITYAQTDPNFQGQGCFRYLLTTAVTTHGEVLSDEHQTASSRLAWSSLIKYPGPNLEIFVYDLDTGHKTPAVGVPESDIWNNKGHRVLLIKHQSTDAAERNNIMTALKESTGIDRTFDGIWYGPNSSTDTYTNP